MIKTVLQNQRKKYIIIYSFDNFLVRVNDTYLNFSLGIEEVNQT